MDRELIHLDAFAGQIARNFGGNQNQVRRRVAGVEMNEIFEHRQRLMFRSVGETSADARPAAAISKGAFSVERRAGVGLAQHPIDLFRISLGRMSLGRMNLGQLIPP